MATTKWAAATIVALSVVLVVVSFLLSAERPVQPVDVPEQTVDAVPDAAPAPREVTLDLRVHRGGYSPDRLEVRKGDSVTIRVRATDGLTHGLSIPAFGVSETVEPGQLVTVTFIADAAGEFDYYSNVASNGNAGNIRGILAVLE